MHNTCLGISCVSHTQGIVPRQHVVFHIISHLTLLCCWRHPSAFEEELDHIFLREDSSHNQQTCKATGHWNTEQREAGMSSTLHTQRRHALLHTTSTCTSHSGISRSAPRPAPQRSIWLCRNVGMCRTTQPLSAASAVMTRHQLPRVSHMPAQPPQSGQPRKAQASHHGSDPECNPHH